MPQTPAGSSTATTTAPDLGGAAASQPVRAARAVALEPTVLRGQPSLGRKLHRSQVCCPWIDLFVPLLPAVSLRVVPAMGGFGSSCSLFRFLSRHLFPCLPRISLLLRLLASSFPALKSAVGEQGELFPIYSSSTSAENRQSRKRRFDQKRYKLPGGFRLFRCPFSPFLLVVPFLRRLVCDAFLCRVGRANERLFCDKQMAPPPPVPLRELTLKFRRGTILARVCRMWDYRGGKNDGDIRHVDLVLVDAEGTPMYAEIGADDVPTKKPLLSEGKVYKFERFIVGSAKPSYRPFPMELMIYVTRYTKIEECSDPPVDIPMCVYNLTKFSDLPTLIGETKYFVDVMGKITHVTELETRQYRNQTSPTLHRGITLKDANDFEANIVLWGERATEFDIDEVCTLSEEGPVIAVFVGLLVKTTRDGLSMSGNSSYRWYINPKIPEAASLLKSCESDFAPVERVPVNNPAPEAAEPKPDPREITVAELTQLIPYEIPDEGFRLTVTIVRFNEKQNWWFPSCNRCSRTSLPCPEGYKCPNDNCTGYKFKYKICYIVSDGTAETEVIFFADIGHRLIGKDVKMLMGANRRDGAIPNEIASQIGQKYQITINVTERAYSGKPFSYDVRKIDHAFGRAPVIPRIQPVAAKSLSLKNESSSAKNVEGHKIVPSVAAEEQSPLHEQGTPPPTITTVSAHGPSKSSDKDQDLPKTRGTRRKLFKDPSPDDKEAADTDLNTDLDDDIEDDSLVDPPPNSSKLQTTSSKKQPIGKKVKKN
ncbi:hypothetical protein EJB05_01075, partial [Eragrostis curvula]